jgi:hypothetical protein
MLISQAINLIDMPRTDQPADPADYLRDLSAWHDDLDLAIGALVTSGGYDELTIARLKKRKLQIRDEMLAVEADARLQPEPVCDVNAGTDLAETATAFAAPVKSPGPAFALLMLLAIMAGFWAMLDAMTDSASQAYAALLLLAILGAASG